MTGEDIWDSLKDLIVSKIDKNILSKLESISGLDPNFKLNIIITMKYDRKKITQVLSPTNPLNDITLSPRIHCGQILITGNQYVFQLGNNLDRSKANQFKDSILSSFETTKTILKLKPVLQFNFNYKIQSWFGEMSKTELQFIESIFKDSCVKKKEADFPSKYGWYNYEQINIR
jgi:hypothetical protein